MARQRIYLHEVLRAIEPAFITPHRKDLPFRQSADHRAEFVNALKAAVPAEADSLRAHEAHVVSIRVADGEQFVEVRQDDEGGWVARRKGPRGRPRRVEAGELRETYQRLLPDAQLVSKYLRTPRTAPPRPARRQLAAARIYLHRMAAHLSDIVWLRRLELGEALDGVIALVFREGRHVRSVMTWADFVDSTLAPSEMLKRLLGALYGVSRDHVHRLVSTRSGSSKNRE
jgi:hypothetical protein